MRWALADAKNRFSELFDKALREGPQTVSRRGKEEVVVVAAAEFARLRGERRGFVDFLVDGAPLDGVEIDRDRIRSRFLSWPALSRPSIFQAKSDGWPAQGRP